ncbi:putative flavonoid 3',5'-hydroxylase [Helianthus annuus]|nr:putative flavonoid 3',5'-hydroxylase [Helianthus annuus]
MISEVGSKIILTIITYWSWWWEVPSQQDKFARTVLTVLVPSLIYVWYKWRLSYSRKAHLPPGPYGLPVIGYLPFLSSNLHEKFTDIAHKYGPIFSLQLGSKLHVVVNSMDLAKVVAREQDNTFANRNPPITGLTITYGGMDLVWSNNNKHWRDVRKLLASQVLSNANLNASQSLRTQEGMNKEMQRQLEQVERIFNYIIDRRIKLISSKADETYEEDGRKDFLEILLELKDQKNDPKSFNIIHIKALLINIVVAATDTTSTMAEWVMAEILNNPDVMKKVQDELTEVIGMNSIVEESHFPKLRYLDAVIKETFRLHPPLPFLIHRCPDESCKVGGYTIPKGTIVYINVWAIQRDPENWTNPLEFKPERFLNQKWDYNGNNFKFLPFGSGRRICPGLPLGEKMLVYILASLLHSFDWSLPKDEELELSDEFGFVTKKRKPLIAIPSQRLSDASLYF